MAVSYFSLSLVACEIVRSIIITTYMTFFASFSTSNNETNRRGKINPFREYNSFITNFVFSFKISSWPFSYVLLIVLSLSISIRLCCTLITPTNMLISRLLIGWSFATYRVFITTPNGCYYYLLPTNQP